MIQLSQHISLSLMLDVTRALSAYTDSTLGHFCVQQNDTDGVELCAVYPGAGMFPTRTVTIMSYPDDAKVYAEAFATDLNTLFNLKPA